MMNRLTRVTGLALLVVVAVKLLINVLGPAIDGLISVCATAFLVCLLLGLLSGHRKEW